PRPAVPGAGAPPGRRRRRPGSPREGAQTGGSPDRLGVGPAPGAAVAVRRGRGGGPPPAAVTAGGAPFPRRLSARTLRQRRRPDRLNGPDPGEEPMPADSPSPQERVNEVIASSLDAAAGRAPDRADLLARPPDLADALRAFFADQDRLARAAAPLAAPPSTQG